MSTGHVQEVAAVRPDGPVWIGWLLVTLFLTVGELPGAATLSAASLVLAYLLHGRRAALTTVTLRVETPLQRVLGRGQVLALEELVRLERDGLSVRAVDRAGGTHPLFEGRSRAIDAFADAVEAALRVREATRWLRPRANEPRCPFCHDQVADPTRCTSCGTAHHAECLAEGGCATLGCARARRVAS